MSIQNQSTLKASVPMRRLLLSFAVLLFGAGWIHAQDAKFNSLFIVNFAKYVEWPSASGDFVITVLGEDPVIDELKYIAEKTSIGEQKLTVTKCNTSEQIGKCNIVYVTPGKSNTLATVVAKFGGSNVLIVTNKEGLAAAGAAINLAMIDGKQRYEINQESLKKSGLVAKPVLFKLGKAI
jgi:hypothetical protein